MKKLPVKAILSTLLIIIFICLAFSGSLLYFGKTGVILGISRYVLREVHFWVAASMCLIVPVHLFFNLRLYKAELRSLGGGKRRSRNAQLSEEAGNAEPCSSSEHNESDDDEDCHTTQLNEDTCRGEHCASAESINNTVEANQKAPNKKKNNIVYLILCMLLAAVAVLALLNRGDAELRRALEENREFQILMDGSLVSTVSLQELLDLGPEEFTTSFATSISAPRETKLNGIELRLLLEAMEVDISLASRITVSGLDSYYSPLAINEILQDERIYICFAMDGELLKPQGEGGFGPFLMVIRGSRFAQRWCKYVEAVDVITS